MKITARPPNVGIFSLTYIFTSPSHTPILVRLPIPFIVCVCGGVFATRTRTYRPPYIHVATFSCVSFGSVLSSMSKPSGAVLAFNTNPDFGLFCSARSFVCLTLYSVCLSEFKRDLIQTPAWFVAKNHSRRRAYCVSVWRGELHIERVQPKHHHPVSRSCSVCASFNGRLKIHSPPSPTPYFKHFVRQFIRTQDFQVWSEPRDCVWIE